jgi:tRNA-guanine family transglycosylase
MRFYVSWYPDDPYYQLYDDDCAMLVSVSSVARNWTLANFPKLPRAIIIDSGGYRYALSTDKHPTPAELLERQLKILGQAQVRATLCALDFPIIRPDMTSNERDRCITQTIAYACEFKCLVAKYRFTGDVDCLAVIQGYDIPTLSYCARELKAIGFARYGLGSLALLKHHDEILARARAVMDIIGSNLHVFGIGSIYTLKALKEMGVQSADSARPAKSAAYNQVFYSHPFRRFAIAASQDKVGARMPQHRRLVEPLPCDCPACHGRANPDILKFGKKEHIGIRAIHNYYHLKQEITT